MTLLKVLSDELPPHPAVAARVAQYRRDRRRDRTADRHHAQRLTRKYTPNPRSVRSVADVMRAKARSDVAITNAGGLRADLPSGAVDRGHVLDAFPFLNDAWTLDLPGGALRGVARTGCLAGPPEWRRSRGSARRTTCDARWAHVSSTSRSADDRSRRTALPRRHQQLPRRGWRPLRGVPQRAGAVARRPHQ